MSDLVEFLRARLDEREAVAKLAARSGFPDASYDPEWSYQAVGERLSRTQAGPDTFGHIVLHDPASVLAEVAAKRRILDAYKVAREEYVTLADQRARSVAMDMSAPTPEEYRAMDMSDAYLIALRLLAAPHAAHPDFDPAWKVG